MELSGVILMYWCQIAVALNQWLSDTMVWNQDWAWHKSSVKLDGIDMYINIYCICCTRNSSNKAEGELTELFNTRIVTQ